jgi:hypothetical protein
MISVEPIVTVSQLWDFVIIASRANISSTSSLNYRFSDVNDHRGAYSLPIK